MKGPCSYEDYTSQVLYSLAYVSPVKHNNLVKVKCSDDVGLQGRVRDLQIASKQDGSSDIKLGNQQTMGPFISQTFMEHLLRGRNLLHSER